MNLHHLLPVLPLLLTACGVLQPVKDLAVNQVLEALVTDRDLTASAPAIAINRPALPGYLDRQQLVTRTGGELVLSEHDLWAEPLASAIARVTASNLSRLTGSMKIQPVESFITLDYTALLELKIARFEPDGSNNMILQGTWQLQPVTGPQSRTRFFRIAVPVVATPAVMTGRVSAMNQALEHLARQIAREI